MTTTIETEVKATVDRLIMAGTPADLRALDAIYQDDTRIEMIDKEGGLAQADKPTFIAMMQQLVEASSGTNNSWARYKVVEGDAAEGHVLITRKVASYPPPFFYSAGPWPMQMSPKLGSHSALIAVNDRFNAAAAAHDAEVLLKLYDAHTLWIAEGEPASKARGPCLNSLPPTRAM